MAALYQCWRCLPKKFFDHVQRHCSGRGVFIISGFCIHYPYVSGREFSVSAFYISRLTRIAIPMLAAIGISLFLPHGYTSLEAVLWSLYCEIVYYTIYPLLRLMYSRFDYYYPLPLASPCRLAWHWCPISMTVFLDLWRAWIGVIGFADLDVGLPGCRCRVWATST